MHQLSKERKLILGGVYIPSEKGSLAHSDGDVLIHAICDALLGAACLGDIGMHFPDTSQDYKNIDSKILLQKVMELLNKEDYAVVNIDSTICLQSPKLKDCIKRMQQTLASILMIDIHAVSIKATTTEKLGFIGREEGISSYAVALIAKK